MKQTGHLILVFAFILGCDDSSQETSPYYTQKNTPEITPRRDDASMTKIAAVTLARIVTGEPDGKVITDRVDGYAVKLGWGKMPKHIAELGNATSAYIVAEESRSAVVIANQGIDNAFIIVVTDLFDREEFIDEIEKEFLLEKMTSTRLPGQQTLIYLARGKESQEELGVIGVSTDTAVSTRQATTIDWISIEAWALLQDQWPSVKEPYYETKK